MRLVAMLMLLLLAGCQKSFEQRYSDVESEVKQDAEQIDRDLQNEGQQAAK
ncbi:MAG: hypothetical protein IPG54_06715 [Sphingomonadales bacterium]|jgi:hypothetical protein|nr:hypothetical protein [Sphingomonadales bacterium]MBK9002533.1 hypothetical protein [Sphingomonadales bacterium]MBK9267753.1 hypothetical protein [Sphingomonadales bacterium]